MVPFSLATSFEVQGIRLTMKQLVEPVYRQLGAKVQQMRDVLGWTQEELASKVGLNRTSIANIEAGSQRILLHDVETFAKAFGCQPRVFLRGIWT